MYSPQMMTASGTIAVSRFVAISGDHTVAAAGSGDVPIGISQDGGRYAPIPTVTDSPPVAAISGEQLQVHFPGAPGVLLELGDTVTAGQKLKPSTGGVGIPVAGTGSLEEDYGAIAMRGGASGEKVPVLVWYGRTIVVA